jgi:hypothetical protein
MARSDILVDYFSFACRASDNAGFTTGALPVDGGASPARLTLTVLRRR